MIVKAKVMAYTVSFGNWFRTKYFRLQLLHHPFALRELYVIALFYVIYLLY